MAVVTRDLHSLCFSLFLFLHPLLSFPLSPSLLFRSLLSLVVVVSVQLRGQVASLSLPRQRAARQSLSPVMWKAEQRLRVTNPSRAPCGPTDTPPDTLLQLVAGGPLQSRDRSESSLCSVRGAGPAQSPQPYIQSHFIPTPATSPMSRCRQVRVASGVPSVCLCFLPGEPGCLQDRDVDGGGGTGAAEFISGA